jgi:hypothetical protein
MFNDKFKERLLKVSLPAGIGRVMTEALESDNHVKIRYLLEELLDDPDLYLNGNTGFDRMVDVNKYLTYTDRLDAYSEFMEILNNKLDEGELLPEYRLRI